MNNDIIYQYAEYIICSIRHNEAAITAILKQTETYKTAKSEIDKSIFCLKNIDKQISYIQGSSLSDLCVFLPMNQPLYSIVLFAIIPSYMFDHVFCRPPVLLSKVYSSLFAVLNLSSINIACIDTSRRDFLKKYAAFANAIIYTGKYENAIEVMDNISPNTIFIFQGSGTNPIIITQTVILTYELVCKVADAQLYNSGQDCMAPSVIFVSRNHWERFLSYLTKRLNALIVGEYTNELADIAPLIKEDSFDAIKLLFENNQLTVLYGGEVDSKKRLVYPTIIKFDSINLLPFSSNFSPIFCLYCYDNETDISSYLLRRECQENKAYVSVFGKTNILFDNEIVINDDTLDSVDNGYSEFGGFGKRSGFVSYNGTISSKPILISKELAMYHNNSGVVLPVGDLEKPMYEVGLILSNTELTGKNIIEIGGGTIPHASILAPYCATYVAIDTNQRKVTDAVNNNSSRNLSIDVMSGADIKYETQTFDIALMFHCLHEVYIEEQGTVLKEIHRVLKEKGLLIIIEPVSEPESEFQRLFDVVHEHFFEYRHIFAVKHAEWVIGEYEKRNFFRKIKTETHKMVFTFSAIDELVNCILRSFTHEYNWDDKSRLELTNLISKKYGNYAGKLEFEEIIKFQIWEKVSCGDSK